jgi:PAS domain S-box-containing protein
MSREPPQRDVPPFVNLDERGLTEDVFRQLLDAAPDAVVVVDELGRIVLVNVQTERLFGYRRDDLIGREIEALIPDRFKTSHVVHRTQFVKSPKIRPMGSGIELFGRRRDGTEFPIEVSISPMRTATGTLVSANVRDITDRRRSELLARRTQQHLMSAVESIQGAFAIFDAQDCLVLCNSECRHVLGSSLQGEIVGRRFEDLLAESIKAGVFGSAEQSLRQLQAAWLSYHANPEGALEAVTSGGRRLRIFERPTAEGGTLTMIVDETEQKAQQDELRRAYDYAEAANSAKSEFLSSMSHELRTPLNAILGFAQLLQRDKREPLSERHRERVEHVLKGGDHLLRLIDEILDLSRIEAGRIPVSLEPVGVAEALTEVEATLDPMATRAGIDLIVAGVPDSLPQIVADRTRFKQILMNYGSNAIKYGHRNGRVRFEASRQGGVVRIAVTDDGIGIPSDKQDKIFQPFHRAGQETGPIEGSGIGLAITKRLAELMEGQVGFQSKQGEGSTFWVDLPAHVAPSKAPAPPPRSDDAPGAGLAGSEGPRYSIIYIEDNPSSIALMRDLLADFERVDLMTAPTAEIGLELVRAHVPDVVIMDINLPGISGFEAARRLRDWPETREVPVIALSAAAMVRDADRVRDAGFHRYLTKPVKIDELASVLEELLRAAP